MLSRARMVMAAVAATSAIGFAAPAAAQDMGFYAGLTIGQSKADDVCEGVSGPGISCDDKDTAWRILGGYQFNRHFAVEVGYTDLGEVTASGFGVTESIESTAFEVLAVGMMPIANNFSIYGKLGLYRGDTEFNSTVLPSLSETNTDLTFGVGVRYDFTRNLAVRAEWQKYTDVGGGDIGEADVDVISIGVLFKF